MHAIGGAKITARIRNELTVRRMVDGLDADDLRFERVLVWCHYEHTGVVMDALVQETAGWARVMRAPFESQGADVRGL